MIAVPCAWTRSAIAANGSTTASVAKFNWPHNDAESTETFDDPPIMVSPIPPRAFSSWYRTYRSLGVPSTLYPGEWLLEKIRFRRRSPAKSNCWSSGSFTGQKA